LYKPELRCEFKLLFEPSSDPADAAVPLEFFNLTGTPSVFKFKVSFREVVSYTDFCKSYEPPHPPFKSTRNRRRSFLAAPPRDRDVPNVGLIGGHRAYIRF